MDITKAYSTNVVSTPHPIGVNTNPQSFESKVGGSRKRKSNRKSRKQRRKSRRQRRR